MKVKYLLPTRYKRVGWFIFLPCILLGVPTVIFEAAPTFLDFKVFAIFIDEVLGLQRLYGVIENNLLNEFLGISTILGGLLVAFSKEYDEDELVASMRLESLVWAVYWNYGILILALIFVYDLSFYWVMVFNMFTPLVLCILRFNFQLRKFRKSVHHEE